MDKILTQETSKALNSEAMSLNPSTLVSMFEIDLTDIAFDIGLATDNTNTIFRFHNTNVLLMKSIIWKGVEYQPAPIIVEGYETSSQGTPPTPKLSITVNDQGIPALSQLKQLLRQIGDITGAKVTRIRTFAKYLDAENFLNKVTPEDFSPNSNIEFPRDIFYIERKSQENKYSIEYELSSIFDLENVKLPARLVLATKCSCTYRGNGCLYEYANRRVEAVHGTESESILPLLAPPIANDKDERIKDILQIISLKDRGKWQRNTSYSIGDAVYIEKNGIKYYFVSKVNSPQNSPPNLSEWIADTCSKTIKGCRLRWGNTGDGGLMFNGFPATNKIA